MSTARVPRRIKRDNRAGNIARDAPIPEMEVRNRKDYFFVSFQTYIGIVVVQDGEVCLPPERSQIRTFTNSLNTEGTGKGLLLKIDKHPSSISCG